MSTPVEITPTHGDGMVTLSTATQNAARPEGVSMRPLTVTRSALSNSVPSAGDVISIVGAGGRTARVAVVDSLFARFGSGVDDVSLAVFVIVPADTLKLPRTCLDVVLPDGREPSSHRRILLSTVQPVELSEGKKTAGRASVRTTSRASSGPRLRIENLYSKERNLEASSGATFVTSRSAPVATGAGVKVAVTSVDVCDASSVIVHEAPLGLGHPDQLEKVAPPVGDAESETLPGWLGLLMPP